MKPIIELWTPVLTNHGTFKDTYIVSNMGRVKCKHIFKNGNFRYTLVNAINGKRPVVRLSHDGKSYRKSVAKLVLSSFQWREGCECANITYLDGNMKNCRLSNLRYAMDKSIFTDEELKKMEFCRKTSKSVVHKRTGNTSAKEIVVNPEFQKSCRYCKDYPCFTGIENLDTDFAQEGCRKYKPKSIKEINQSIKQQ